MGGGNCAIRIRDTGIGIDLANHTIVLKSLSTRQGGASLLGRTKFKGGGPGLALAIAAGIVGHTRERSGLKVLAMMKRIAREYVFIQIPLAVKDFRSCQNFGSLALRTCINPARIAVLFLSK
jgi:signal transduction histidine kinase